MQINEVDDRWRRHLHSNGAPQKDGNDYENSFFVDYGSSEGPRAQAQVLAGGKQKEDHSRDPSGLALHTKECQMGSVDGIDYAELLGPEAGDPWQNKPATSGNTDGCCS
uniref:Uncharacterized protein n=1 Tax=Romanomermis culicivorax TaxID=13658 RepID=A0A915IDD8_ROMCU